MIIDKSELFISWHMIIKDNIDHTLRSLDSLQGVYDENIIAVDIDSSQDELYEKIKIYPNTYVFRQKLPNDNFSEARQDVLDRVSKKATYIGWSDSDEELVNPSPREVREYLYNERPPSVNVILRYLGQLGPCAPGDYYRVRMWRTDEPRIWKDATHEWPSYEGTTGNAVATNNFDIVFNHLKIGDGSYASDFRIDSMMKDLEKGGIWRLPRLSGEYRGIGKYKEALDFAKQGVLASDKIDIVSSSLSELLLICSDLGDKWGLFKLHLLELMEAKPELKKSPLLLEYLALSYYYSNEMDSAKWFHSEAKNLDSKSEFKFIKENDKYFQ